MKKTPTTSLSNQTKSVFRTFNVADFAAYQSWKRLELILQSNGGAYGIAGPRGSGKTWLISKSVEWARENRGVGLWFPVPSDYGAEPFLSALADNFASEVQRQFPQGTLQWYHRFASKWILISSLVILLGLYFSWGSPLEALRSLGIQSILNKDIAAGAYFGFLLYQLFKVIVWIAVVVISLGAAFGILSKKWIPAYLYMKAIAIKQRLRYSETLSSSLESSAKFGKTGNLGINLQAERNLAERAWTIASLIYEFRDFMRQVAERIRGPIVIGIDELDKMHDTKRVKELLRDIKGIFEVNRVHFLVSISDEARKTLNLGSLQERDEFNSSFYTVIDILPNSPSDCANLLAERSPKSFDQQARLVIGILGGGNLREVLRLADICLKTDSSDDSPISMSKALSAIASAEARALRNEVLAADLPELLKVEVYRNLELERFSIQRLLNEKIILLSNTELSIQPESQSTADEAIALNNFLDLWSKFHIRFQIIQHLVKHPQVINDGELTAELQNIVITTGRSAAVAEHCLKELLPKLEV